MMYGKDALEDKKLKNELMKMMMEGSHGRATNHLSKEDAEKMTIKWLDEETGEWTYREL